jgi:RHS repeat-associated protein
VTAFGTGIDDTVRAIEWAYTTDGRLSTVTSLGVNDTVLNQVQYAYDVVSGVDLGHLTSFKQEHNGAVGVNSHELEYDYATNKMGGTGVNNYSRLEAVTYENGTRFRYSYDLDTLDNDLLDVRTGRMREIQIDLPSPSTDIPIVDYQYLGTGTPVVVDYLDVDLQLDYTAMLDGKRGSDHSGEYPNLDRFGRVLSQRWVFGDYADDPFSTNPTKPTLISLDYTYDRASNRLSRINSSHMRVGNVTGPGPYPVINEEFEYDGLDRLDRSWRGRRTAGVVGNFTDADFTHDSTTEDWALDMLGNWAEYDSDANEPLTFNTQEDRTHNNANELTLRDFATGTDLAVTYDKAGNIATQQTAASSYRVFEHDAWGRLVRVHIDANGTAPYDAQTAEYEYNGLNWQIEKRAKVNYNMVGTSPDQQRTMYYNPSWQLIEEAVTDDYGTVDAADRYVQYLWGSRGLNDIVLRRESRDLTNDTPDVTYELERYYCTDPQFTPVAIVKPQTGETRQPVSFLSYTPYGKVKHQPYCDIDGDGEVGYSDWMYVNQHLSTAEFGDTDTDMDGDTDTNDWMRVNQNWDGDAVPDGTLSDPIDEDNIIGYCGYIFNSEFSTYTARNRIYDPDLGRWLRRDPLGYVDGSNVYQYVSGRPMSLVDVFGLTVDMTRARKLAKDYNWYLDHYTTLELMLRRRSPHWHSPCCRARLRVVTFATQSIMIDANAALQDSRVLELLDLMDDLGDLAAAYDTVWGHIQPFVDTGEDIAEVLQQIVDQDSTLADAVDLVEESLDTVGDVGDFASSLSMAIGIANNASNFAETFAGYNAGNPGNLLIQGGNILSAASNFISIPGVSQMIGIYGDMLAGFGKLINVISKGTGNHNMHDWHNIDDDGGRMPCEVNYIGTGAHFSHLWGRHVLGRSHSAVRAMERACECEE